MFQSRYYAVGLSPTTPQFVRFSVDSLGQGKLDLSPLLAEKDAPEKERAVAQWQLKVVDPRHLTYLLPDARVFRLCRMEVPVRLA